MYLYSRKINLSVAQLVEQLTLNQWVTGSSPVGETTIKTVHFYCERFFLISLSPMNRAKEKKEVWLKASVIGTTWAASEIILGSFLHNLHIPFKGNILTAIGIILLISAAYKWKDKGLFWRSGVVCAIMKTMSPSAVIFGPMVAIIMEAFLFEFSMRIIGRNAIGYIFGAVLAMSWVFFQKIANLLIYYGNNIIDIYEGILNFIEKELKISTPLFWEPIFVLLSFYVIFGTISALFGIRTGKSLQNEKATEFSSVLKNDVLKTQASKGSHPFPYSIYWLVLSLISMIILLYVNSMQPMFVWLPLSIITILVWVFRYKRAMRQITRPRFWISFMLITILAAVTINYLNGDSKDLTSGLLIGIKMNVRAAVVFVGFSVLGTELYNPVIREKIRNSWMRDTGEALEVAFESLPQVVNNLPDAGSFIRKPVSVIRLLLSISDNRISEIIGSLGDNKVETEEPEENLARVFIITGSVGEGKTTSLIKIAAELKSNGLQVAGIISPRIVLKKETVGYNIRSLNSDEEIPFLRKYGSDLSGNSEFEKSHEDGKIGRYEIQTEGLSFGQQIIEECLISAPEIIIIDEVGRLELEGRGWDTCLKRLVQKPHMVILSVRNKFVDDVINHYGLKQYQIFKLPFESKEFLNRINQSEKPL